jgi:uncharacterized protein
VTTSRPLSGVGLGLRWDFDAELVESLPPLDFLEVAPENYVGRGGYHADAFDYLAGHYPIVTHGLSLSLGGLDPLDERYLAEVRGFIRTVGSPWHSDHLSFGTWRGERLHDLLPIALSSAGVERVASRIRRAQDLVGAPLCVENISFYLPPSSTDMPEGEFVARVLDAADCGLLLDVNNLYVNATNFGFDTAAWLDAVPMDRVTQIHVAGHEWFDERLEPRAPHAPGALIVDTHGADVSGPVLCLLEQVLVRAGPVPVVLERDNDVPSLPKLLAEIATLKAIVSKVATAEQGARVS